MAIVWAVLPSTGSHQCFRVETLLEQSNIANREQLIAWANSPDTTYHGNVHSALVSILCPLGWEARCLDWTSDNCASSKQVCLGTNDYPFPSDWSESRKADYRYQQFVIRMGYQCQHRIRAFCLDDDGHGVWLPWSGGDDMLTTDCMFGYSGCVMWQFPTGPFSISSGFVEIIQPHPNRPVSILPRLGYNFTFACLRTFGGPFTGQIEKEQCLSRKCCYLGLSGSGCIIRRGFAQLGFDPTCLTIDQQPPVGGIDGQTSCCDNRSPCEIPEPCCSCGRCYMTYPSTCMAAGGVVLEQCDSEVCTFDRSVCRQSEFSAIQKDVIDEGDGTYGFWSDWPIRMKSESPFFPPPRCERACVQARETTSGYYGAGAVNDPAGDGESSSARIATASPYLGGSGYAKMRMVYWEGCAG